MCVLARGMAKDPAEIEKFTFEPMQESSNCYTVKVPSAKEFYYQGVIMSGRPGTHHIIITGHNADAALTEC